LDFYTEAKNQHILAVRNPRKTDNQLFYE